VLGDFPVRVAVAATADVVTQAFLATAATYLLTAIGTLPVLFFHSAPRRLMDAMMGFAAGVARRPFGCPLRGGTSWSGREIFRCRGGNFRRDEAAQGSSSGLLVCLPQKTGRP
jgi:hypothetical protein